MQDLFFADDKECRLIDLNALPVAIKITKKNVIVSYLK